VISTVSGGSIVGAYYYLKLKRLLESKADREITRADYQQLVREMLDEFLAAVQKNVRLLTFAIPSRTCGFEGPITPAPIAWASSWTSSFTAR